MSIVKSGQLNALCRGTQVYHMYVAECAAGVCILNIFPLCLLYFNTFIITAIPLHYDI